MSPLRLAPFDKLRAGRSLRTRAEIGPSIPTASGLSPPCGSTVLTAPSVSRGGSRRAEKRNQYGVPRIPGHSDCAWRTRGLSYTKLIGIRLEAFACHRRQHRSYDVPIPNAKRRLGPCRRRACASIMHRRTDETILLHAESGTRQSPGRKQPTLRTLSTGIFRPTPTDFTLGGYTSTTAPTSPTLSLNAFRISTELFLEVLLSSLAPSSHQRRTSRKWNSDRALGS